MNKLNKQITKQWFKEDGYNQLRKFWSEKMQKREKLSCRYHIIYKILIGKNWTTGINNEYDYGFIFAKWALADVLHLFKDFIDAGKAYDSIKDLVGNHQEPYKAEACQKIMSIQ